MSKKRSPDLTNAERAAIRGDHGTPDPNDKPIDQWAEPTIMDDVDGDLEAAENDPGFVPFGDDRKVVPESEPHESTFYDQTAIADAAAAAKPARARPVVPEWDVTVTRLVVESATTKVRAYTSIEATHIALNVRPPRSWKRGAELVDHGYPRAQCITRGTGLLEVVEPAKMVEGDLFASDAAVGGRVLESRDTAERVAVPSRLLSTEGQ